MSYVEISYDTCNAFANILKIQHKQNCLDAHTQKKIIINLIFIYTKQ